MSKPNTGYKHITLLSKTGYKALAAIERTLNAKMHGRNYI